MFSVVVMNGRFLPILTNLVNFVFFALAAVMLCSYWRLPKSVLIYSVTGLLFVLQTYTIARMYGMGGGYYMVLPFFVLAGFLLGNKAIEQNSKARWFGLILFATLSFWFVIGTYPVVVSTIAVVFIGKIVIEFISAEDSDKNIIRIMTAHIWTIFSIIMALCFHILVVVHLKKIGELSTVSYMTDTVTFRDIPARIFETIQTSFRYLVEYKAPFFPRSFTLLFTVLFLISVFSVSARMFRSGVPIEKRLICVSLFLVLFYAALFFSFTSSLITKTDVFFWARVDFFGIAYFHILIATVLF
jgi:hypothetical protein